MRLIHRAATYAYSFVAMNWDQVAALAYLARGGEAGAEVRQARPGSPPRGLCAVGWRPELASQPETQGGP